jgi:hypothetical protein
MNFLRLFLMLSLCSSTFAFSEVTQALDFQPFVDSGIAKCVTCRTNELPLKSQKVLHSMMEGMQKKMHSLGYDHTKQLEYAPNATLEIREAGEQAMVSALKVHYPHVNETPEQVSQRFEKLIEQHALLSDMLGGSHIAGLKVRAKAGQPQDTAHILNNTSVTASR